MTAKGTYGWVVLATPDLDATFDRVQAADAEVVQEPVRRPYGVRRGGTGPRRSCNG